jgi:hypothetical protein
MTYEWAAVRAWTTPYLDLTRRAGTAPEQRVSNTNKHLPAGAGRTARALVPRPSEWRWMAAGDESPWFPGFRIYRQSLDDDWTAALWRLQADLLATFGSG